ncbi:MULTISPECIES: hypothetical protein [Micromonospora]|uniref:Uncharacterized protein n=1 Tax=Micromonospora solifontis TaxID=2487138 RepID=A0ABX9WFQ8_9ACTN|nr:MULTISPECIES: hypothetical protein [Micromonospora]NES16829.1 hypothetical protein [Micromonospora sp. PPF5-17B]NES37847.1 hypothetical protein [Micromonospora solifontis]NES58533.1 hypothetical protein [Micromonospora sp. PPF5-6]RNL97943.1 hypothetical protein EFE23_17075 [Micromonospora solifontis]
MTAVTWTDLPGTGNARGVPSVHSTGRKSCPTTALPTMYRPVGSTPPAVTSVIPAGTGSSVAGHPPAEAAGVVRGAEVVRAAAVGVPSADAVAATDRPPAGAAPGCVPAAVTMDGTAASTAAASATPPAP